MVETITSDNRLHRLLQLLLPVRHSHLRPLLAVAVGPSRIDLHYGQPGPCPPACGGVVAAVCSLHAAGLWVGNVRNALGLDACGRVVLGDVGSAWDLRDPFQGHPSARGGYDLRIAWRQHGDVLQLADMAADLLHCQQMAG